MTMNRLVTKLCQRMLFSPRAQILQAQVTAGSGCYSRRFDSAESIHTNKQVTQVLFDGECKICEIEISALRRFTRNKRNVEFVDISLPGYDPEMYGGVSYEAAMKEMHVIGPGQQVLTQGDAIRQMYRACGLGWVSAITELPWIKPTCDKLYTRFAVYRLQKALDRCDSDSCSIKLHQLREKLGSSND